MQYEKTTPSPFRRGPAPQYPFRNNPCLTIGIKVFKKWTRGKPDLPFPLRGQRPGFAGTFGLDKPFIMISPYFPAPKGFPALLKGCGLLTVLLLLWGPAQAQTCSKRVLAFYLPGSIPGYTSSSIPLLPPDGCMRSLHHPQQQRKHLLSDRLHRYQPDQPGPCGRRQGTGFRGGSGCHRPLYFHRLQRLLLGNLRQ